MVVVAAAVAAKAVRQVVSELCTELVLQFCGRLELASWGWVLDSLQVAVCAQASGLSLSSLVLGLFL
jgi:hypothetical protein